MPSALESWTAGNIYGRSIEEAVGFKHPLVVEKYCNRMLQIFSWKNRVLREPRSTYIASGSIFDVSELPHMS
jgi:hypothetical protein